VRRIFVMESMMIGVMGLLLGWMIGLAMTWGMQQIEFKSPFMDANHLPVLYSWRHYAIAGLVAFSASVIAGYFPARKAAAVQPVEIIRGAS
jgi:lipoprotein-releasing system permease protein